MESIYVKKLLEKKEVQKTFCPYRVCPLGAHIDHQHGIVTGFALDKGIEVLYVPDENGICRVSSANMDGRKEFSIHSVMPKVGDWADHFRGTVQILQQYFELNIGIEAYIIGSLPIGGLSSSAAAIIAFMSAVCRVNNIELSEAEIIHYARMVENSYVGVSCGKLDQSTEVYSKKDHLMYLDTDTDEVRLIPRSENMRNYEIGVFFSGVSRSLAKTGYNMRVDECKAAAYALKAFEGIEYHKFNDTYLRDVPYDVFEKYKSRLPVNWMKRAQHFYSENARAKRGARLWEEGDLYGFGKLISESGHSSIYSYETGSKELKTLYEGLLHADGVYGTRFSGAGFEGCCMAVVDPKYKEEITRKVTNYYLKEFPKLSDAFEVHYCSTADGVEF